MCLCRITSYRRQGESWSPVSERGSSKQLEGFGQAKAGAPPGAEVERGMAAEPGNESKGKRRGCFVEEGRSADPFRDGARGAVVV